MGHEEKGIGDSFVQGLIGYHLRRAWMRNLGDFTEAFGDEIKPVPFSVLCLIDQSAGITAAEIGRQLKLQRANLAPMLGDLEGRGLIERRPDREDHRVQRLHLSAEGAATLAGWQARNIEQEARSFAALSTEERDTLIALLSKVWAD